MLGCAERVQTASAASKALERGAGKSEKGAGRPGRGSGRFSKGTEGPPSHTALGSW